jgi:hypothetical protein
MRNNKEKANFEEKRKAREREKELGFICGIIIIELIFSRYFHFIIYGH